MHNVLTLGYYQMSEIRAHKKIIKHMKTYYLVLEIRASRNTTLSIGNQSPQEHYQKLEIRARKKIIWAYETILSSVKNQSPQECYLSF